MTESAATNLGQFLTGTTVILSVALLAQLLSREPLARQRIGEWTTACFLLWALLFCVPLPRWSDPAAMAVVEPTTAGATVAGTAATPPAALPAELPAALLRTPRALELDRAPDGDRGIGVESPADAASIGSARPTVVSARPEPPVDWGRMLGLVWAIGTAWFATRLLIGATMLRRRLRALTNAPERWQRWLRSQATPRRRMTLLVSDTADRPFCTGLRSTRIVVPASLFEAGHEEQLRCILLHELAHVERGDPWRQLGLVLAAPLLWFHPLFYWLRRNTRLAAEVLADHHAVRRTDRTTYARALLDLAESRDHGPTPMTAIAAIGGRSAFYRRMSMLLETKNISTRTTRLPRLFRATGATALTAACVFLWGAPELRAQDPETKNRIDVLEHERDELRLEIKRLRDELTKLRKAWAASPQTTKFADTDGDGLPDTRVDKVADAAEPAPDKREQAAARPEASGVPRLSEIPLVARWLRHSAAADAPATTAAEAQPTAGARPTAEARPAASSEVIASFPVPGADSAPSPNHGAIGAHVIDLATRAIDLQNKLKMSELAHVRAKQLAERQLLSSGELEQSQLELDGLRTQARIVRILIDAETEATEREIAALARRMNTRRGDSDRLAPQLARLEGRLKVLKTVR